MNAPAAAAPAAAVSLSTPAQAFATVVRRDLLLAMRRRAEVLTTLFFFVIVVSLFPLGVGPETDTLRTIAPGVVWVAALLASMLALQRLFALDYADGTLEQLLLAPQPLGLLVAGQGTRALAGVGSAAGAHRAAARHPVRPARRCAGRPRPLAAARHADAVADRRRSARRSPWALRGGGVLVSLLVLPLYIPVLIFGAGAVEAGTSGLGAGGAPVAAGRLPRRRGVLRALGDRGGVAHLRRVTSDPYGWHETGSTSPHPTPSTASPAASRRGSSRWPRCSAIVGLYIGFFVAPTDAQQGEAYRIIFIHVPAAWMSMFLYVVMAFWAGVGLGLQHAALVDDGAPRIAPTGALLTFLALWTGALWGKPMWGTWWVWDARLTSELILLFLYIGFMSLQAAIDDPRRADKAGAVLALVGVDQRADHLLLGEVVEHAAPGRVGQPDQARRAWPRPCSPAC